MVDEKADHDGAYKKLFASPKMVRSLIAGFFSEELAAELDFTAMTPVNVEFRSQALDKRQSDTIWKIPSAQGQDVYVLFLLEFQSRVDHSMAIRVMLYVSLLYEMILGADTSLSGGRLPPVLPVVLYNGKVPWTARRSVREMIRCEVDSPLWNHQPDMRYYLIDVGALDLRALDEAGGPVALLFELERVEKPEHLAALIDKVREVVRANPELEELYVIWFKYVLKPRTNIQLTFEQVERLTRDKGMLSETIQGWYEEAARTGHEKGLQEGRELGRELGIEEGREEGREEGLAEGLEEGRGQVARAALRITLKAVFGEDPARDERLAKLGASRALRVLERLEEGGPFDDEASLFSFEEE